MPLRKGECAQFHGVSSDSQKACVHRNEQTMRIIK